VVEVAVDPPTTGPQSLDDMINRVWKLLTGVMVGYAGLMFAWGAIRTPRSSSTSDFTGSNK
jgi:hypothetical protein